ncbi:MAG: hypothetical protein M0002_07360 [Rhodospirillales bacterium]|nr:hypothetical protein [Rhodospirillales bacterium]
MPLVKAHRQAKDLRWRVFGDETREGACMALATQFIICMATKQDL